MSDNKIQGRAKKFDGTAIDYVSIFNWTDGTCIAQVVPDASGNWQYAYSESLSAGVTYIADGCEPITHGAYDFTYEPVPPSDTILHYSFNGNVLDSSINALNGIKTGNANFVAGRKAGTQAINFIAGCVQTPQVLPINSDKLTVSFWISTSQTSYGAIYETSQSINSNPNTTICSINDLFTKSVESVISPGTGFNISGAPIVFDDSYQHVIIEIDRSKPKLDEQKIYVNNVLKSTSRGAADVETSGLFVNHVLYIGKRFSGAGALQGRLQDMRVYNRTLTADERAALYNE